MATGFHGFHVLIGTIFLTVCLMRLMSGGFTPKQHFGFEAAAWYWHFVDVVWLFLFAFIYVIFGAGWGHRAADGSRLAPRLGARTAAGAVTAVSRRPHPSRPVVALVRARRPWACWQLQRLAWKEGLLARDRRRSPTRRRAADRPVLAALPAGAGGDVTSRRVALDCAPSPAAAPVAVPLRRARRAGGLAADHRLPARRRAL